jgi:hypothetical protein
VVPAWRVKVLMLMYIASAVSEKMRVAQTVVMAFVVKVESGTVIEMIAVEGMAVKAVV